MKTYSHEEALDRYIGVKGTPKRDKIESGRSITYASMVKVFKALGGQAATLDLGSLGRVALW